MTIFLIILSLLSSLFLLVCSIAFLKAKDVFVMNHIVIIIAFYALPTVLLAIIFYKFSAIAFLKIFILAILNIVSSLLITHLITKTAISQKIFPQ